MKRKLRAKITIYESIHDPSCQIRYKKLRDSFIDHTLYVKEQMRSPIRTWPIFMKPFEGWPLRSVGASTPDLYVENTDKTTPMQGPFVSVATYKAV